MTAAHPISPDDRPRPGLRERKKIRTREAIRSATYELIEERGYAATTIEQIADRAEVSPSTVLRYFPAKEDIVLTDELCPLLLAEFRARPVDEPWLDSLRNVLRRAIDLGIGERPEVTRLRCRLMAEIPAVRSRMLENLAGTGHLLGAAIGERAGRDPESLEVRVLTTSLVAALAEVAQYWARTGFRDDPADLADRALTVYDRGLGAENP
ncbi:TetR/AcrR family transcriptional regulator [Streptomyces sp. NPDC059861]|uniref:TetR/AcrR family transcriptional regulator n=1 Tax=Streptomyces sp. NPDC059861 TaxID=3346974 RepID=UPI00365EA868